MKSPKDPGNYSLEVRLSGHKTEHKKVSINPGRKAVVSFYLDPKISRARLFVTTSPLDCRIRILNINPVFHNGIELEKGKYKLEVSKQGYETKIQWVDIVSSQGIDLYVELEKNAVSSQSTGTADPGQTWTDPVTGMEFVWVEAGCYQMGSNSGGADEKPIHEVCVDGFWMGQYEVTQGQWKKIIGSNRVSRGGSWGSDPGDLRCARRGRGNPGNASDFLGFRLIRTD